MAVERRDATQSRATNRWERRYEMSAMTVPGFTADASAYRTINHYRSTAGGSFGGDGSAAVLPQKCPWYSFKGIACEASIYSATGACAGACEVIGPACASCWLLALGGVYALCKECVPEWVKAVIQQFQQDGGGDSAPPVLQPCPSGQCCAWDSNGNCTICRGLGQPCPGTQCCVTDDNGKCIRRASPGHPCD